MCSNSGDVRVDRARLRALLAARKVDLSVRAMVWRAREESDARESGGSERGDGEGSEEFGEGSEEFGEGDGEGEESMELDEVW